MAMCGVFASVAQVVVGVVEVMKKSRVQRVAVESTCVSDWRVRRGLLDIIFGFVVEDRVMLRGMGGSLLFLGFGGRRLSWTFVRFLK